MEQYIKDLYKKACNTSHKNKDLNIIIDQESIIGTAKEIENYLADENDYLKENTNETENYETLIRNNEALMERIRENKNEDIMGIIYDYDKYEFVYEIMEIKDIIKKLESILEINHGKEREEVEL